MSLKKSWSILKGTFNEFSQDKVLRLGAALAYYAMFSLGPLLIIIIGVAGLVLGHETVRGQIEQQLQGMLGPNAAKTIDSMMAAQKHGTSLVSTILDGRIYRPYRREIQMAGQSASALRADRFSFAWIQLNEGRLQKQDWKF
jgi:hypothetical protein